MISIIDDFGKLNDLMKGLIETVKCYRYDLGSALHSLSTYFFRIIERTLDTNIALFNESKNNWEK